VCTSSASAGIKNRSYDICRIPTGQKEEKLERNSKKGIKEAFTLFGSFES